MSFAARENFSENCLLGYAAPEKDPLDGTAAVQLTLRVGQAKRITRISIATEKAICK